MKVVFIIEQPEILRKLINPDEPNPGFGGTSFTAIRLAVEINKSLNSSLDNLEIFLGTESFITKNYNGIPVVDLSESYLSFDIAIVTGGILDKLINKKLKINARKFISWIRHPYDQDKFRKSKLLNAEVVSVGKAQYISNILIGGISKHHHIDNLFDAERIRKAINFNFEDFFNKQKEIDKKEIKIGYMGALIQSKGFHHIAENWKGIKKDVEKLGYKATLEVIGGAKLYGFIENHKNLPCEKIYGDKISFLLSDEINSSVKFHGTLGLERYSIMQKCDLAIINPNGDGEAFPATILEWLSLGVPTISSLNYGCGDVMSFLPSMVISNKHEIKNKVLSYIKASPERKLNLTKQALYISNLYTSNQQCIVEKWKFLLQKDSYNLLVNEYLNFRIYKLLIIKYLQFLYLNLKVFSFKKLRFLKPLKKHFYSKGS